MPNATEPPQAMTEDVPPFEPHPLLRGGHAQTIAGRYMPSWPSTLASRDVLIDLPDGDQIVAFESVPDGWAPGDPMALLVHGLAGCARSPYVVRIGRKLVQRGVLVWRMNLRGAGAGFGLARGIYHAGRTGDVRSLAGAMAQKGRSSPLALVGFSLGASLVLKLAAEAASEPVEGLDCVLAANPPIDLMACCEQMRRPENRIYDRNFIRLLHSVVRRLHARFPDLGAPDLSRVGSVFDFDDLYTAPRNGFADAADYYARSSRAAPAPDYDPGTGRPGGGRPVHPARTISKCLISCAIGTGIDL